MKNILPPDLGSLIQRKASDSRTTPEEFAALAVLAEREGGRMTAYSLRERANVSRRISVGFQSLDERLPAAPPRLAPKNSIKRSSLESPIAGVPADKWQEFVKILGRGESGDRKSRLGIFGLTPKRLSDLGVMTNIRSEKTADNAKTAFSGDFVGMSESDFLTSPSLQYEIFARSISDYAKVLPEMCGAAIGKQVSGQGAGQNTKKSTVTLSGLLALAHLAGIGGVKSWLQKPEDRKKFTNTTNLFLETTGLF